MKLGMPRLILALCVAVVSLEAGEAAARSEPVADLQLTGVMWLNGKTYAALRLPAANGRSPQELLLGEEEGAYEVQVLRIFPTTRRVDLKIDDQLRQLILAPLPAEAPGKTPIKSQISIRPTVSPSTRRVDVTLRQMPLSQALEIYGLIAERCVLRPEKLPAAALSLDTLPRVPCPEAMQIFEAALLRQGIALRLHENRYVLALPSAKANQLTAQLPAPPPASNTVASVTATNQAGTNKMVVRFAKIPLPQALQFYSEIAGHKELTEKFDYPEWVARIIPPNLPLHSVSLNAGAMTRAEVLHALDTLLALNGLKVEFRGADGLTLARLPTQP